MASPAVTTPPGELMYKLMSLSASSLSKNSSCATTTLALCAKAGKQRVVEI
jgi:hypothetical protein